MAGQKFFGIEDKEVHGWTPIRFVERAKGWDVWLCRCRCGTERRILWEKVIRGQTKSCGCLGRKAQARKVRKHGLATIPEYKVWRCMIQRCENPAWQSYPYYGGRGIKVCERWHDIRKFIKDMGRRPSEKHQLDRMDNNGNYEPGNVRWVTKTEQARNQKNNHRLTYKGETLTVAEWTERLGFPVGVIRKRINDLHWPIEKALTTAVQKKAKRRRG